MTPVNLKGQTLLVANRGEIAVRIARTARAMGIPSVALFSAADRGALHTQVADEAYQLQGDDYLDINAILSVATLSGATLIHPGYGFLSENPLFARQVRASGRIFVGPDAETIELLGDKVRSKEVAESLGIPLIPGFVFRDEDGKAAKDWAISTGFPVLVKAAAGGGGRGMRRVDSAGDLDAALASASREARALFGSPEVFIEKLIAPARHVEVQLFGDLYGNVIVLGDRDCTMQRSHQKVIEEAPAPNISENIRQAIHEHARLLLAHCRYSGAGTAEFLLTPSSEYFFLEVNSRLQVEHPVTEEVLGIDLVDLQIKVALGHNLQECPPKPGTRNGHAIEARLCAEDPEAEFLPSSGDLKVFDIDGNRVETGYDVGDTVPPLYDSLVAKIIGTGSSREEARRQLLEAVQNISIAGIETNSRFLCDLLESRPFQCCTHHITYAEEQLPLEAARIRSRGLDALLAAVLAIRSRFTRPLVGKSWTHSSRWTVRGSESEVFLKQTGIRSLVGEVFIDSLSVARSTILALREEGERIRFQLDGRPGFVEQITPGWYRSSRGGFQAHPTRLPSLRTDREVITGTTLVRAPLPGKVLHVLVQSGGDVQPGEVMVILESMKMEHPLRAPSSGKVIHVAVRDGQIIEKGAVLLELR